MDQPVKMLLFFLMDGRWSDGAELGGCFFCCLHFDSVVSFQCFSRLTEVFHSGLVSYNYVNLSCALELVLLHQGWAANVHSTCLEGELSKRMKE